MGPLVLKPCLLRLYAPLRDPSKRKRAADGKILELPEPGYLRIKKMEKLKKRYYVSMYIIPFNKTRAWFIH